MNRRAFLISLVVFLAMVLGTLIYLWPRAPAPKSANPGPGPADLVAGDTSEVGVDDAVEEMRREEIAAAYEELSAARKALQKELGNLKGRIWGLELPGAEAKPISDAMMAAQFLLKNPPLLGAFADVAGVRAEQARVNAALVRLGEIARVLDAKGASD